MLSSIPSVSLTTAASPKRDAASLYAADLPVQEAEMAEKQAWLEEVFVTPPGAPTTRETLRLRARTEHLTRALDRLVAAQAAASGLAAQANGVTALASGSARLSGGFTLAVSGTRIAGLYTDFKAGLSPADYYNDARRADRVTISADLVTQVDTAGGDDTLSISADRVSQIYTGNDADTLVIAARMVRNIFTEEDTRDATTRPGADSVTIAAALVEGVFTGGGDDTITLAAERVDMIDSGEGDDRITIAAGLVAAIYAGAGNDRIEVQAIAGRQWVGWGDEIEPVPDLSTPEARLAASATVGAISAGAGNDEIHIAAAGPIGVAGEAGDDRIFLEGGSVSLFTGPVDGHDTVTLGAGTELIIRLARPIESYELSRGDDSLILTLGSGSITLHGVAAAGMIAVQLSEGPPEVLWPGAALDRSA